MDEGFIEVNYRKNGGNRKAENKSVSNQFGGRICRYENNDRNKNGVYRRKEILKEGHNSNQNEGTEIKTTSQTGGKDNEGRKTNEEEILTAILKSNNKYSVLENEVVNEEQELRQFKDIMIVDQYLNKKLQPTTRDWTKDMIYYFKVEWEEDRMKGKEAQDKQYEDVLEGRNKVASVCSANEVSGMSTTVLN